MTKKKRQRKEQHHHHGNPPPPQVASPLDPWDWPVSPPPANLRVFDETAGDDLWDALDADSLDDVNPFAAYLEGPGTEQTLRPVERNLMRMQRYLERKGIVVTPENEKEVEEMLAEGEWRGPEGDHAATALDRAQDLVYDAFEANDLTGHQQASLAKQALRVSRNCADAHTLLAEYEATTDEIALRHYTDAIKAAELALKDVDLTARPGDFWYLMKLRPLLRALAGAADTNVLIDEPERALALYRRLYEIDALDLIEVRESYIGLLSEFGLNEELIEFLHRQGRLKTIEDESVHVEFSLVLAFFRMQGDSGTARMALAAAAERHPRVVGYLLGAERINANDLLGVGAADEGVQAVQYFVRDIWMWLRTPNAIEWVRANAG
jgi:hypothetical protein